MSSHFLLSITTSSLLSLFLCLAQAQEAAWSEQLEAAPPDEEGADWGEYLESLTDAPLDLNHATLPQFQQLFNDSLLAKQIWEYCQANRPLNGWDALVTAGLLSAKQVAHLMPSPPRNPAVQLRISGRHRFLWKTPLARAFVQGDYAGNPAALVNRLTLNKWPVWRAALLIEKDAGERSIADFSCGYLQLRRSSCTLTLGHYLVESGQGLFSWGPYRLPLGSALAEGLYSSGRGIVPFAGSSETAGLRGMAVSLAHQGWQGHFYCSNRLLDATLSEGIATSLAQSGLHRSESEIKKRRVLRQKVAGMGHHLQTGPLGIGFYALTAAYSVPIGTDLADDHVTLFGGTIDWQKSGWHVFSEVVCRRLSSAAWTAGIIRSCGTGHLIWLIRDYPDDFSNPFGNAIFSRRNLNNEKGNYLGWHWRPCPGILLTVYGDCYRIPAPSSLGPMPFSGTKTGCQLALSPLRRFNIHFRFEQHSDAEEQKSSDRWGNAVTYMAERWRRRAQINLQQRHSRELQTQTRIEWRQLSYRGISSAKSGLMFVQQIDWQIKKAQFKVKWTAFDAVDSGIGFCSVQSGIPGTLSFIQLSGRGHLESATLRIKFDHLNGALQVAHLAYDDRTVIGTDDDQIAGNHRYTVTLQIDWQR
ncbi:MAG TPA: hypothetical protein PKN04_05205 [bacterium]|nr:hypothetical protein [bacterium]HNT65160.1 hypothetical protein [bacterium]